MKNYLVLSLLIIVLCSHIFAQNKFHHPRIKVKITKDQSSGEIKNETKEQEQNMELTYPLFESRWEEEILQSSGQSEPLVMQETKVLTMDLSEQEKREEILLKIEVKRVPKINPSLFSSLKERQRLLSVEKNSMSKKTAAILAVIFFVVSIVFMVIGLVYLGELNTVGFVIFLILFLLFAAFAIMFAVGSVK